MIIITILTLFFLTLTVFSQRLSSSVISPIGVSLCKLGLYISHTGGQEGRVDSKKIGSLNIQQGCERQMLPLFGIRNEYQLITSLNNLNSNYLSNGLNMGKNRIKF
jgi:hypothetical protein